MGIGSDMLRTLQLQESRVRLDVCELRLVGFDNGAIATYEDAPFLQSRDGGCLGVGEFELLSR